MHSLGTLRISDFHPLRMLNYDSQSYQDDEEGDYDNGRLTR